MNDISIKKTGYRGYEWATVGDKVTVDTLYYEGVRQPVTVSHRWDYDGRGHLVARYVVAVGTLPREVWGTRASARERAIEWAEVRGIVVPPREVQA